MATEVVKPESTLIMEKEEEHKTCNTGTSAIKIDECPLLENQQENTLPDKSQEGSHVPIDNEKNKEEELKDSHDTSLSTEGQYLKEDSSPPADTKIDHLELYSNLTAGDEITQSETISDLAENAFTKVDYIPVVAESKNDTISKDLDSDNKGTLEDDSSTMTEDSQESTNLSLEMKQPSNEYELPATDNVLSSKNDQQSSSSEKLGSIRQSSDTENTSSEEFVGANIGETALDKAEEVPKHWNPSTVELEDNHTENLPVEQALEVANDTDTLHASIPLEVKDSGENSPILITIEKQRPECVQEASHEVFEAPQTNVDKNIIEEVKEEEMPKQHLGSSLIETNSDYAAVHDLTNGEENIIRASEDVNLLPEELNQDISVSKLTLEEEEHHGSAVNAEKDTKTESTEGDGCLQKLITTQTNELSEENTHNLELPHTEDIQAVKSTEIPEVVVPQAAEDDVWEQKDVAMAKESEDIKEVSEELAYPSSLVSIASEQHVDEKSLGTSEIWDQKSQETVTSTSTDFSSKEVDPIKSIPELEMQKQTTGPDKQITISPFENEAAEKAETGAENESQDHSAHVLVNSGEIQSADYREAYENVEDSRNETSSIDPECRSVEAVVETNVSAAAVRDLQEIMPTTEIPCQEETVQVTESKYEGTNVDEHTIHETTQASFATTINETLLQNQESKTADSDDRGGSTEEMEEYNYTELMEETKEDGENLKPEIRRDGEHFAVSQSLETEILATETDDTYTEATEQSASSQEVNKEAEISTEMHTTEEKDASIPEAIITRDNSYNNENHGSSCENPESLRQVSDLGNKSLEEVVEADICTTALDKAEEVPELGYNQSLVEPEVTHTENLLDEKAPEIVNHTDPLYASLPSEVAASGENSASPFSIQEQAKSVQEEILEAQRTNGNIEEVNEEKIPTQQVEGSTVDTSSDCGMVHNQNNIEELIKQVSKDDKSSAIEFNQDVITSNLTLEEHPGNPENAEEVAKPESTKGDDEFPQENQIKAQAKEEPEKENNLHVEDIHQVNSNKIPEAVILQAEKEVPTPKESEEIKLVGEEPTYPINMVSEASEEHMEDKSLDTKEIYLLKEPEETIKRTSTGFRSEEVDHVKSISELDLQSQTEPDKESIISPAENGASEKAETSPEIESQDHRANVIVNSGEIQSVEYHDADKNVESGRIETRNVDPECESVDAVLETNVADATAAAEEASAAGYRMDEMPPMETPNQEEIVEVVERENDCKSIDENIVYETSDAIYAINVNETLLQNEESKISDSDDNGGPTKVIKEEQNGTEVMESESKGCLSVITDASDEKFEKTEEPAMEEKKNNGENVEPENTNTDAEHLVVSQSVEGENQAIVTDEKHTEEKDSSIPITNANEEAENQATVTNETRTEASEQLSSSEEFRPESDIMKEKFTTEEKDASIPTMIANEDAENQATVTDETHTEASEQLSSSKEFSPEAGIMKEKCITEEKYASIPTMNANEEAENQATVTDETYTKASEKLSSSEEFSPETDIMKEKCTTEEKDASITIMNANEGAENQATITNETNTEASEELSSSEEFSLETDITKEKCTTEEKDESIPTMNANEEAENQATVTDETYTEASETLSSSEEFSPETDIMKEKCTTEEKDASITIMNANEGVENQATVTNETNTEASEELSSSEEFSPETDITKEKCTTEEKDASIPITNANEEAENQATVTDETRTEASEQLSSSEEFSPETDIMNEKCTTEGKDESIPTMNANGDAENQATVTDETHTEASEQLSSSEEFSPETDIMKQKCTTEEKDASFPITNANEEAENQATVTEETCTEASEQLSSSEEFSLEADIMKEKCTTEEQDASILTMNANEDAENQATVTDETHTEASEQLSSSEEFSPETDIMKEKCTTEENDARIPITNANEEAENQATVTDETRTEASEQLSSSKEFSLEADIMKEKCTTEEQDASIPTMNANEDAENQATVEDETCTKASEQLSSLEEFSPETDITKGNCTTEEKNANIPIMNENEEAVTTSDNSAEKLEEHRTVETPGTLKTQNQSDQIVAEESRHISIEEKVADYSPLREGNDESLHQDTSPEVYPGIKMSRDTEIITEPDDSPAKETTSDCATEKNEEKNQDQLKEEGNPEVSKADENINSVDDNKKLEEPEMINATENFLKQLDNDKEEVVEMPDDLSIAEQEVRNSFADKEKEEKNVNETNKIVELKPVEDISDPSYNTEMTLEDKVTELPHQVLSAEETEDHFQEGENGKSYSDRSIDEQKLEFEGSIIQNVDKAEVEPPYPQDSITEVIDDSPGEEVKATPINNEQQILPDQGVNVTEICESINNASESTMVYKVDTSLNSNEDIKEDVIGEAPSQGLTEEILSEEGNTTIRDASETEIDKEMSEEQETAESAAKLNTEMKNQGKDIETSVAQEVLKCNPAERNDERKTDNTTEYELKPAVDPEVKVDKISKMTEHASPSIKHEETDVIDAIPTYQEHEQPCQVLTAEKTLNFTPAEEGLEEDYVAISSKEDDLKSEVCKEVAEDETLKEINSEIESAKMTDAKQMKSEDKFIIREERHHVPTSEETSNCNLQEDEQTKVKEEIVIDELREQVDPEVGANEMPVTTNVARESTKVEGDNKFFDGPPQFSDHEEMPIYDTAKETEERGANDTTLDTLEQEKVDSEISELEDTDTVEATQSSKHQVDEQPSSSLTAEETVDCIPAKEQEVEGDVTNTTKADQVKSEVHAEVVQRELSKMINNEGLSTKTTSESEAIIIEENEKVPVSEEIVNYSLPEEEGLDQKQDPKLTANGMSEMIQCESESIKIQEPKTMDATQDGKEVFEESALSPNEEEVLNYETVAEKKEEQRTTLDELQPEVHYVSPVLYQQEEPERNDSKSAEETGANNDEQLGEYHVSETEPEKPVYEAIQDSPRSNDFTATERNCSVSGMDHPISQDSPHDEREEQKDDTEGREAANQVDKPSMEMAQEDDQLDLTEANDNSGTIHVPFESAIAVSDSEVKVKEDPKTGTDTKISSQDEEDTTAQKGLTGETLQPEVEPEDASKAGAKPLNSIPQESSLNDDNDKGGKVEEQGKLSTDTREKKLHEDENEDKKIQNQDQYPSPIMEWDSVTELHGKPKLFSEVIEAADQNDNPNIDIKQKNYLADLTDSEVTNMPFEIISTTGTSAKIARQDDVMLIPEKGQSGTPLLEIQAMDLQDASDAVPVAVSSFTQESNFEDANGNKVEEEAKLPEQTSATELSEYDVEHKKLHDQDDKHSSLVMEQDSPKDVPEEPNLHSKSSTEGMLPESENKEVSDHIDNSSMELEQKDDLDGLTKSEATDMAFESTIAKSDSVIMTKEDPTTGFDIKVANQHEEMPLQLKVSTTETLQRESKELDAEDACKAQAEATTSLPQESSIQDDKKEEMVEASISSFPITDFKDSNKTKRRTESSTQEGTKHTKLNEDENTNKTFQDQNDHHSSLAKECEPTEAKEEDASVPSLHDLLQKSRNANSKSAEDITSESTQTSQKEAVKVEKTEEGSLGCDEQNTEEHKDEEVVEGETKRDAEVETDSADENPVMVEASRDATDVVKVPQKKSHNILSGVGSKVKHSIAKVKKAITGKSSSPKPSSPTK